MKFIDEAKIDLEAGDGGNGCIAFRRETFIPRGGPSGGNGAPGGSIYFVGSKELTTLMDFRYNRLFRAPRGEHGRGSSQHGKAGEDLHLPVPLGTQIFNAKTDELIADILEPGQTVCAAKAGRGGRGNESFRSSINQAPMYANKGDPGEQVTIRLELKIMADVGLIGFPNAGKSTFLSAVSNARPKIADYPFTTVSPCLGVVQYQDYKSFVVADLPGLIEGAHEGKGMGDTFLRHCERTKVYLHLVSMSPDEAEDPVVRFEKIEKELFSYDAAFKQKKHLLLLTKMELISEDEVKKTVKAFAKKKVKTIPISSVARLHLQDVVNELGKMLFNEK